MREEFREHQTVKKNLFKFRPPAWLRDEPRGIEIGIKDEVMRRREYLTEAQLNHHVQVVGASGFGKSVLLSHITRSVIESGKGLLFVDLKADLTTVEEMKKICCEAGREEELLLFSMSEVGNGLATYNPISRGSPTQLRDRIMASLNWSEEYYKNMSMSILLKIMIVLDHAKREGHRKAVGLQEVCELINDVKESLKLANKFKDASAKVMAESVHKFLLVQENFNSLQGLRVQLESLLLSDFGARLKAETEIQNPAIQNPSLIEEDPIQTGEVVTSANEGGRFANREKAQSANAIDLFRAVQEKKIVVMLMDSRSYSESSKALGAFILQDLKAVSARIDAEIPESQREPFTIVIDEFADFVTEDFVSFLDRARSSKMRTVIAHQEVSDLDRISPEFKKRLIGNVSTLYVFQTKNPESVELICQMAGTRKEMQSTDQTERFLGFDIKTGAKSWRETDAFVVHPNSVKSLARGECIVIKKIPRAVSHRVRVHPMGSGRGR